MLAAARLSVVLDIVGHHQRLDQLQKCVVNLKLNLELLQFVYKRHIHRQKVYHNFEDLLKQLDIDKRDFQLLEKVLREWNER